MKFFSVIVPAIACAAVVEAGFKPKKPKFGSGHDDVAAEEDLQQQQQQANPTASAFFAQTTGGLRDVHDVITSFYPTATPTLLPQVSTTLASSLLAVESSWFSSPEQLAVDAAIMSAAPVATAASFALNGYVYQDITTEVWYMTGVPKRLQDEVMSYIGAIESVHEKYVEASVTGAGSVPTRAAQGSALRTHVPITMGAVGIVGAVLAML